MQNNTLRIAIVQKPSSYLDLEASLIRLETTVQDAADQGAQLIVFGETWLCGYPAWLDHCPNIATWNHGPTKEIFAKMHANGVEVPGETTKVIGALAQKHHLYLIIGVNEIVRQGQHQGSLFNTILAFDPEGELILHHRKLMPTYTEKLLYNTGDGHGLKSLNTPFGKIGSLICWEHWMPLTRQAMHLEGEHLHLALWPAVNDLHQLASRHYAVEGRCFVVAAGQILQVKDIPEQLELPDHLKDQPNQYLLNGGSCVIKPDGSYLVEPLYDQEQLIVVDLPNLNAVYEERMTLDVTGHYNRPDVFTLGINRERL